MAIKLRSVAYYAGGAVIAFAAPRAFHPVPTLYVTTTISRATIVGRTAPDNGPLNLNVQVRCGGQSSEVCESLLSAIRFSALDGYDISVTPSTVVGPPERGEMDPFGRRRWRIAVNKALGVGDSIGFNAPFVGQFGTGDLELRTVTGDDMMTTRFSCLSQTLEAGESSKTLCRQIPTWSERLAVIIPMMKPS